MNVTLTSLEALTLKATNETLPWPDEPSVEAFCAVMRQSPDGPQMAAQTLAARIHTPNPRQALLALTMTDLCMRKCGPEFLAEIGKFRFLNELIKLVSPKYLGEKTAPEIKARVLQFLYSWSMEYSQEFKLKVAYDMLKNQGVVKETPPPLPPEDDTQPKVWPKRTDPAQDKEKAKLLQKLLQSKKPEDIQHANRLIKTMVREEEKQVRRTEASFRQTVRDSYLAVDSAKLLREMINESCGADPEHQELIHDVHSLIVKMRLQLNETVSGIDDSEAKSVALTEIIRVNDILDEANDKYEAYVEFLEKDAKRKKASNLESLLDFAGASVESVPAPAAPKSDKKAIDELGDLFATESRSDIAAPLQPINLMPNDDVDLLGKPGAEGWNELDSLGEQLLKQSLPENASRVDNFNGKTKKIPMNALSSPKHEPQTNSTQVLDLDFFTKKPEEAPSNSQTVSQPLNQTISEPLKQTISQPLNQTISQPLNQTISQPLNQTNDDAMVDITEPPNNNLNILDLAPPKSKTDVKPLTDINVTLQSVQPSNMKPVEAYKEEDGLMVQLHICKDKPRPDVSVVVISTTSVSPSAIDDFKLQFVVPKGCKVRLLTPSGTSLPPFNPFLPPPAVTQIMLIGRPGGAPPIDLKYVLTYNIQGEAYSEMGEVRQFPLDDIY